MVRIIKLSQRDINFCVNMYNRGMSTVKLGKIFDCDARSINNRLKKAGVKMRSNKENSRRYFTENEDYFDEINTQEKAYLLGFIYADGFITSRTTEHPTQNFGITISEKDKEILDFVIGELKTTYPIKRYEQKQGYAPGTYYIRLLICSQTLVDGLKKNGVWENKTNILEHPNLPQHLVRHFIRGYLDGDGSIHASISRGEESYNVSFVGTDNLLMWISDYFFENNLIHKKAKIMKRKEEQIVSYIRWGGNFQVKKILDHLYEGGTFSLTRKKEKYLALCNKLNGSV